MGWCTCPSSKKQGHMSVAFHKAAVIRAQHVHHLITTAWWKETLIVEVGYIGSSGNLLIITGLDFFKYFRIRESPVLGVWKSPNQRTVSSSCFKNLKEPKGFRKEPAVVRALICLFQTNCELWFFFYQTWEFNFLRTMVMNLKNHPDTHQGSVQFLMPTQHW
jgi:hypothetical protein